MRKEEASVSILSLLPPLSLLRRDHYGDYPIGAFCHRVSCHSLIGISCSNSFSIESFFIWFWAVSYNEIILYYAIPARMRSSPNCFASLRSSSFSNVSNKVLREWKIVELIFSWIRARIPGHAMRGTLRRWDEREKITTREELFEKGRARYEEMRGEKNVYSELFLY